MTIGEFLDQRVWPKHPDVLKKAKAKGIQFFTLIVIKRKDVHHDYHVIVEDDVLRDAARPIIRGSNRDLRCEVGPDTVLCVADSL